MKPPITPLNGLSVMLAECFAIVNLKNKSASTNSRYEEKDYLAFHLAEHASQGRGAVRARRDLTGCLQSHVRTSSSACRLQIRRAPAGL
jgi:hypothetical protein